MTSATSDPVPVLVTGVGGATLGEQVLKALLAAATPYHIIATDLVRESLGLALADVGHVVPPASDDAYLPRLEELCERHRPAALIPTSEAELRVVSAARQRFEERGVFLPINRRELIDAGDEKVDALDKIVAAGARAPVHRVVASADLAANWSDFPCVVKPSFGGSGSANVFIAQTPEELRAIATYLLATSERVLIEEYVGNADSEFTVAVLHDMEGGLIQSIAIRRAILAGISNRLRVANRTERRELGDVLAISSGVSQGRIGEFRRLRDACERLAVELDSRGPLNIQCRWFRDELVVFEINPRFSGTTLLRALAGFNEPDLLIRLHVLGEEIERGFEYTHGTVVRGLSEMLFAGDGGDS